MDTTSRKGSRAGGRRARRQFSEELRIGAVPLVLDEGKRVGTALLHEGPAWVRAVWPALLVTLRRSHTTGMKSKVHPTYKTKYRVANWPAYNRALVRRGDVTVWLSSAAIAACPPRGVGARKRGFVAALAIMTAEGA